MGLARAQLRLLEAWSLRLLGVTVGDCVLQNCVLQNGERLKDRREWLL